jgi:alpha-beta hydrolase superfamily lysophospholipase
MAEFEDRTYPASDASPLPVRLWRAACDPATGKALTTARVACPHAVARACVPSAEHAQQTAAEHATPPSRKNAAALPVLLYLHGIQSHLGWYEASSRWLAGAGVTIFQVERRGSGRDTAHPRGHVDAAETWVRDVHAAAEFACRETGARSVHLMGVSWGGKLALAAAGDRPALYRSLILAAPGLCAKIDAPLPAKLRIALALATGRPEQRFPIPLDDPRLFTENPERIRYLAADTLRLREVTARFLFESRRLDRLARRAASKLRSPVLLALAERDLIIDNAATLRLYWSMGVRRRMKVYAGAQHTLEFEAQPEEYFRDLAEWTTKT